MPGSVANLGGGFDTLGVAVQLFLRATITDIRDDGGTRLVVTRSTPAVTGENALEKAFAVIARQSGARTPSVFVEVESEVPMAAGLGSSAAATQIAAVATNHASSSRSARRRGRSGAQRTSSPYELGGVTGAPHPPPRTLMRHHPVGVMQRGVPGA